MHLQYSLLDMNGFLECFTYQGRGALEGIVIGLATVPTKFIKSLKLLKLLLFQQISPKDSEGMQKAKVSRMVTSDNLVLCIVMLVLGYIVDAKNIWNFWVSNHVVMSRLRTDAWCLGCHWNSACLGTWPVVCLCSTRWGLWTQTTLLKNWGWSSTQILWLYMAHVFLLFLFFWKMKHEKH